jgi:hypothetical protein
MKLHPVWFAAALVLPLCTAGFAPADELRFAPAAGLKLSKEITSTQEQTPTSMRVTVNGEEQQMPGDFKAPTTTMEERLVFTDEYVRMEGSRVLELVRHFEELGDTTSSARMGANGEAEPMEIEGTSELEGHSVRFAWDADAEAHVLSWVGEGADDELLEGLELDADGVGLLPEGAVAVGETWNVPLEAFKRLMEPGGDLRVVDESDDEHALARQTQLRDNLDGEVQAEYKGLSEEGGRKLARIALSAKLTTNSDQERDLNGASMQESAAAQMTYEGELLWDAAAGHLVSVKLEGELAVEVQISMNRPMPDGSTAEIVQTLEIEITTAHQAEYSKAD